MEDTAAVVLKIERLRQVKNPIVRFVRSLQWFVGPVLFVTW